VSSPTPLVFSELGQVFTANMTYLSRRCVPFASGSVVGGRLTNEPHRTPAKQLLIAMYAEVVFLCVAAA
jgi:hypothetical protein